MKNLLCFSVKSTTTDQLFVYFCNDFTSFSVVNKQGVRVDAGDYFIFGPEAEDRIIYIKWKKKILFFREIDQTSFLFTFWKDFTSFLVDVKNGSVDENSIKIINVLVVFILNNPVSDFNMFQCIIQRHNGLIYNSAELKNVFPGRKISSPLMYIWHGDTKYDISVTHLTFNSSLGRKNII